LRPICWVLAAAIAPSLAAAQEPPQAEEAAEAQLGTFSLQWENDRFGATDRNYTNGIRLAWISEDKDVPDWARDMARTVPIVQAGSITRMGATVGQSIFTPEELGRTDLIPDQRPYGGWLYGGVSLHSELPGRQFQTFGIDLGVVGPGSMAAETQNLVHRIIDAQIANGWEHQIRWEPGIVLTYEYRWLSLKTDPDGLVQADLTPHIGGMAGNVFTNASAGAMVRVGDDLEGDFGPPRVRPALPGSTYFSRPDDGFRWYVFAGAEARFVARNIFLDGNTFRSSHSVDKERLVADFQAGISLTYRDVRLAFTHVWRTPEFKDQDDPDRFGSVSLSVRF